MLLWPPKENKRVHENSFMDAGSLNRSGFVSPLQHCPLLILFFYLGSITATFYFSLFLFRLKGLEQVTKATMLGHLLPVLLTTLMHPNLQTLTLADALMPQLVQLVLYTSQVRVLPIPNLNSCNTIFFFCQSSLSTL